MPLAAKAAPGRLDVANARYVLDVLDRAIAFAQRKTGRAMILPLHPRLRAAINRWAEAMALPEEEQAVWMEFRTSHFSPQHYLLRQRFKLQWMKPHSQLCTALYGRRSSSVLVQPRSRASKSRTA